MSRYAQLAYTDSVQRFQAEQGSAAANARRLGGDSERDLITANEAAFIESRDGFYLGSVSETGWPYVQFRGGPPGFVHVLDEHRLAFAEVRGNRQYISDGNIRADGRVSLFFMDYARQARLKLFGRASLMDTSDELHERLMSTRTDGRVERLVLIEVEAFNWNCPQHITPRFTADEVRQYVSALHAEIASLREQLKGT
ncbi:pyridoxamine 5'-phosphate oxidase family protein [Saccharopolyspora taberi]|uniref:Pyridoxamine 5'-phosphate oxidase family protein n=1 Tax=Saccharopolyspora taberi TaxID=60895 RepID=A0ABN3V6K9_9PSEU